jgi:diguanylate cyclase (GGDEF)-like protein
VADDIAAQAGRQDAETSIKIQTRIPSFIMRWIPSDHTHKLKDLTRSVTTVCILFFNLLMCIISWVLTELNFAAYDDIALFFSRLVIATTVVVYAISAFYLTVLKKLDIAGHFIVLAIYLSCLMGISLTGGYTNSPITSLLILPPAFGFVLLGRKRGTIWTGITITTAIAAWTMEGLGMYTPMQAIPSQAIHQSLQLAIPIITALMVVGSILFYDTLAERLQDELEEERNKFQWDATHDALTGLPNRPEFFQRMNLAIRNAQVNKQELALAYFDLDGFKPVNDTMGHHAGDIVLKVVGDRLNAMLRNVDTVARLGGDEFAIIFQGFPRDESKANKLLEKVLGAISDSMIIDGKEVSVGASLGIAYYEPGDTADSLCKKADKVMYDAKKEKNTWRVFEA